MLRFSVCAALVVLFTLNVALSDTYRGKVKSVDTDAKKLVITVDDKEQTFDVPKDVKIFTVGKGKKGQPGTVEAAGVGFQESAVPPPPKPTAHCGRHRRRPFRQGEGRQQINGEVAAASRLNGAGGRRYAHLAPSCRGAGREVA